MKKVFTNVSLLLLMGVTLFFVSCNENDPLPVPMSGFSVIDADILEKGVPVKFVNESTNAASYMWDFDDGTKDSLNASPEHIFTAAGTYEVKLISTSQDGQTSEQMVPVEIKSRYLTAFSIENISFANPDGNPWDDDDTGPDVIFIFNPQSATDLEEFIITDTVQDVQPKMLPLIWEFNENSFVELSDEMYDLFLIDADPEKAEDPKYDVMFGIEFNPVIYNFTSKGSDNSGFMQISLGGFAIDMFLEFSLQ